jgi:hypothetical protein
MKLHSFSKKIITQAAWLVLVTLFALLKAQAQGQDPHITFSGIIIEARSNEPLPGAAVQIPRAGKGILSNNQGYFSIRVFPGDSVVFSFLGFKKQYYKIPKDVERTYSAVIELQEDSKMLKEVKVYPYSTEEAFKEALVNMKLPDEAERQMLEERFGKEAVQAMVSQTAMGANGNYRYMMNQQQQSFLDRGTVRTLNFTNPFAWMSFIRDVKSGALKDKSYKAGANSLPKENLTRDEFFRGKN